jgi:DMSO/TMAO reductase YedYZ molybdopterin-dependent catalytic subunit
VLQLLVAVHTLNDKRVVHMADAASVDGNPPFPKRCEVSNQANLKVNDAPADQVDRRNFLCAAGAGATLAAATGVTATPAPAAQAAAQAATPARSYLTNPSAFADVSRGNPRPYTLKGEQLVQARLTPATWRLEIVSDGTTQITTPRTIANKNAIDLAMLQKMGQQHGRRFLKAMQCLNIAQPLGQGLWEGVPLRELLKLVGRMSNIRRIYYWGFHNNDPKQLFQSSLSYTQVMDAGPGELGPFVAYRLNGGAISLLRGGPARMIVPWAHGFKSIKWLQRIVLTNNFQANDTYASGNNEVESYLKTAAYVDEAPAPVAAGQPLVVTGTVMVGLPGLKRVEYWLRPGNGNNPLADDDPAWAKAQWLPCDIAPPPKDWGGTLPQGVLPAGVWGFDPMTGQPREWPMKYSWGLWSATLRNLKAGAYEFRARAVDKNDFAQPEPRPYSKSGRNDVQMRRLTVTA